MQMISVELKYCVALTKVLWGISMRAIS